MENVPNGTFWRSFICVAVSQFFVSEMIVSMFLQLL